MLENPIDEPNNNLPTVYEAEEEALKKMGPDDRSEMSVKVRDNLVEILQAMIESAKGIWFREITVNKQGIETSKPVYQRLPNMDVAQYLLNQLMGKPRETSVDLQLKQNIIVQNEIKISKMDSPRDVD